MKNTKNSEKNQSGIFFSGEFNACLLHSFLPLDAVLMLSEAGVSQCMVLYSSNLQFLVQSSKSSIVCDFFLWAWSCTRWATLGYMAMLFFSCCGSVIVPKH